MRSAHKTSENILFPLYISVFDTLGDFDVILLSLKNKSTFMIPIQVKGKGNVKIQTEALVDSGVYSIFIHERVIKEYGFKKELLPHPYNIFNADNTPNKAGMIMHRVMLKLKIGEHESAHSALITNLGTKDIILGMMYLRAHNPKIDWKAGTWSFSRCSTACVLWFLGSRSRDLMLDV